MQPAGDEADQILVDIDVRPAKFIGRALGNASLDSVRDRLGESSTWTGCSRVVPCPNIG
jgi:hypothetical protein